MLLGYFVFIGRTFCSESVHGYNGLLISEREVIDGCDAKFSRTFV